MRERRESAGTCDERNHLRRRRAAARHEGGLPRREVPIERVGDVARVPLRHERARNGRPSDGLSAARRSLLPHGPALDHHAQRSQAIQHLLDAPAPVRALGLEKARQLGMIGVEAIAEQVHVALLVHRGDLDAHHDDQTESPGGGLRARDSGRRVVVGHRQRGDPGGGGAADERFGTGPAVGRRRVGVKVDHAETLALALPRDQASGTRE